MKKALFLAFVILIGIGSCKKKEDKPQPASTTTGATSSGTHGSTSGSTSGGTGTTWGPGTPTTASAYSGFFTSTSGTVNIFGIDIPAAEASANFYATPVQSSVAAGAVSITSVFLNSEQLQLDPSSNLYSSSSQTLNLSTEQWSVRDTTNVIPTFTINNALKAPTGISSSAVPSSISKSSGVTITFNNLQNMVSGTFILTDGGSGAVVLPIGPGKNVLTFSSAQLAAMTTGTAGIIAVQAENSQGVNVMGKNFKFSKMSAVVKQLTINN